MAQNIIQLGLFSPDDNIVIQRIGRTYLRIPIWVAFQMQYRGGLMGLILDYGLDKYPGAEYEYEVLCNIQDEAEALWRYWRRYGDQHYYNLLGQVDRDLLNAEKFIMLKHPHVKGRYKYELIATRMGRGWGPLQVKAMLEDIVKALRDDHRLRKARKYIEFARIVAKSDQVSHENMPIAV